MAIRLAIIGYGNLGKGVEIAIKKADDVTLAGIFTRRSVEEISPVTKGASVYPLALAEAMSDNIDVAILCGGSATDLPVQTPHFAQFFNVVDSFDNHSMINEHFAKVDTVAEKSGKIAVISSGWDPGLFSINRMISDAILPDGNTYTFWGEGLSQGHSDAVRRVEGVKFGAQYTIPIKSALARVRSGENPTLSTKERHLRRCFVVAKEGADKNAIAEKIKNMPNYFADYDTEVHFITEDEFEKEHRRMNHGGFVIRSGRTGVNNENSQIIEFSLKLESNPEFTASMLVACARAAFRLNSAGQSGGRTVYDLPLGLLSPHDASEIRRRFL